MRLILFLTCFVCLACLAFAEPCHLILIRHAETEALASRVYCEDSDLNDKGKLQAVEIVNRLREIAIDAIYSSPLRRAKNTAQFLALERGLPVVTYDALKERMHGSAEGHPMADLETSPFCVPYYYPIKREDLRVRLVPDAENFEESTTRFEDILKKIAIDHQGQTVVVFSHYGLMKGLSMSLTGDFDQPSIPNGFAIHLSGDGNTWLLLDR
jgi:broad specificity phosphatase PhoE